MPMRRIERKCRARLEVSVRLHGWPKEVGMLTVTPACWMVDLEFGERKNELVRVVNHFRSESYEAAHGMYEQLKVICDK